MFCSVCLLFANSTPYLPFNIVGGELSDLSEDYVRQMFGVLLWEMLRLLNLQLFKPSVGNAT